MTRPRYILTAWLVVLGAFIATVNAQAIHDYGRPPAEKRELGSLANTGVDWPVPAEVWRVATLQNYNTRLVVLSTATLGIASGLIGTFLLLRKRSLMGDALSHACLPGIGVMFIVMTMLGGAGKSLPGLLLGATVTGVGGVGLVMLIRNTTRIKDDAAMGIVLSVFFGLGVAVLGMVQTMPGASAAGLEFFIYGKTASMVRQDFVLICAVALVVMAVSVLLTKEFTLLCFDEGFADAQGWPVHMLDVLMLALVALVTVVGLQAVGLILIIAFLITPAAAARFWTNDLRRMLILAAVIGGLSGWLGASISALLPRLPAGAVIVLVAATVFVFSMVLGSSRGVLLRFLAHRRLRRKVGRQHLLRAVYEILETRDPADAANIANHSIDYAQLLDHRSWSRARLQRLIAVAKREDHVDYCDGKRLRLSESGFGEAARITRNHRLWEMYLIRHADVAPGHVDRDADAVEHVLGPGLVRQLEDELARRGKPLAVPPSPHALPTGAAPA
jgi:manganese/zinc/iron transport system permease protein